MMGHPADDQYASDCLKLWGVRQRYGGPAGYPRDAAFVLKARGISIEWHDNISEVVGKVVSLYLDDEQRAIVKMYYEPQCDPRKNGEPVQCNTTLTLMKLRDLHRKIDRNKLNQALNRAIGKVAMVLSLPAMFDDVNENERKKAA